MDVTRRIVLREPKVRANEAWVRLSGTMR